MKRTQRKLVFVFLQKNIEVAGHFLNTGGNMEILLRREVSVDEIRKKVEEVSDVDDLQKLHLFVYTGSAVRGSADAKLDLEYLIKRKIKDISRR